MNFSSCWNDATTWSFTYNCHSRVVDYALLKNISNKDIVIYHHHIFIVQATGYVWHFVCAGLLAIVTQMSWFRKKMEGKDFNFH
jgi:hypothetical protein